MPYGRRSRVVAGEFVVLLGPSGSGKSTLLNILGGLDLPTAGEVLYRGQDLTRSDEGELTRYRRDHVGFVFHFYNLIPSLTAKENVALVTDIARDPLRPEEALKIVNLRYRLDHFPAQLSGGEQQRVAIARAIAKRPAVLLCDEPTGGSRHSDGCRRPRGHRASQPRTRYHDRGDHTQRGDRSDGRPRGSARRWPHHQDLAQRTPPFATAAQLVTALDDRTTPQAAPQSVEHEGTGGGDLSRRGLRGRAVRDDLERTRVTVADQRHVLRAISLCPHLRPSEAGANALARANRRDSGCGGPRHASDVRRHARRAGARRAGRWTLDFSPERGRAGSEPGLSPPRPIPRAAGRLRGPRQRRLCRGARLSPAIGCKRSSMAGGNS